GGRRHGSDPGVGLRNTPASAGRTAAQRPGRPAPAEHPRVGGEDDRPTRPRPGGHGTPPRRRGGRVERAQGRAHRRNTPASAGRTPASPAASTPAPEHPRVGGEDTS